MSTFQGTDPMTGVHYPAQRRQGGYYPAYQGRSSGWGRTLLIAGLAVAAVGALGWYYLGPDLRRYLKIRNM